MPDTALVVIDIQNDYFPGGAMELEGADAAASKAAAALARFRKDGQPAFHVKHLSVRPGATFFLPGTRGAEIHASVAPRGEPVLEKNFPNSFRNTELKAMLEKEGIKNLVIAGDACATRAQTYAGETVPARQVHAAFLAALNGFYAKVVNTHEL
jgi:nicotinamidase-related amidase